MSCLQKRVKNVAVLISGGGTNLQALLDFEAKGGLKGGKIALVVSSKSDAYGLVRAQNAGVKTAVVTKKGVELSQFEASLLSLLKENEIDAVVLAGFLVILSPEFVANFKNKIINIHPSLLPSFGGEGFYGLRVHQAVVDSGVKVTGATAHIVSGEVDRGEILVQKAVEVKEDDTPQSLQLRVMQEAEWVILPEALNLILSKD